VRSGDQQRCRLAQARGSALQGALDASRLGIGQQQARERRRADRAAAGVLEPVRCLFQLQRRRAAAPQNCSSGNG
jgi:hypothetical protein